MSDENDTRTSDATANEVACYDYGEIRTWLREILGCDGIGEHVHTGQKNAAACLLDLLGEHNDHPRNFDEPEQRTNDAPCGCDLSRGADSVICEKHRAGFIAALWKANVAPHVNETPAARHLRALSKLVEATMRYITVNGECPFCELGKEGDGGDWTAKHDGDCALHGYELTTDLEALLASIGPRVDNPNVNEVERLSAWIVIMREVSSDYDKTLGILARKALSGYDPGESGYGRLRAFRARVPQTGSGHRPEQSGAPTGSSPAGSGGASATAADSDYPLAELEALREVEKAALAYVPYPALTFDERHAPRREALVVALAKVIKARKKNDRDSAKAKADR